MSNAQEGYLAMLWLKILLKDNPASQKLKGKKKENHNTVPTTTKICLIYSSITCATNTTGRQNFKIKGDS